MSHSRKGKGKPASVGSEGSIFSKRALSFREQNDPSAQRTCKKNGGSCDARADVSSIEHCARAQCCLCILM
jgi:hypothetical protein